MLVFMQRTALHCSCNMVRKQRINAIVFKGDSGYYMSVIAFGSVPQRPHPYKTRTSIEQVHHVHAIQIS